MITIRRHIIPAPFYALLLLAVTLPAWALAPEFTGEVVGVASTITGMPSSETDTVEQPRNRPPYEPTEEEEKETEDETRAYIEEGRRSVKSLAEHRVKIAARIKVQFRLNDMEKMEVKGIPSKGAQPAGDLKRYTASLHLKHSIEGIDELWWENERLEELLAIVRLLEEDRVQVSAIVDGYGEIQGFSLSFNVMK